MDEAPIVVVGAGPAGLRAACTLAAGGRRPVLIDEGHNVGGQIFRQPFADIGRTPEEIYGFEHRRARAHQDDFARWSHAIDYRPQTTVWSAEDTVLHLSGRPGRAVRQPWSRLIIATGAMDRIIPLPGWTASGAYSLGAAQIALKSQAVAIGRRTAFFGSGPLLYLVAYQYAKAGFDVAAVMDVNRPLASPTALPGLLSDVRTFAKGLYYMAWLAAHGVPLVTGIRPGAISVDGEGRVAGLSYARNGKARKVACDAVGFGYGLRAQTQLADILDLHFVFDPLQRQWLPQRDAHGRSSKSGIYLAGDGASVRGADIAALSGELAALAVLADEGHHDQPRMRRLRRRIEADRKFRDAIDRSAFPFPSGLAGSVSDDTILCRCEGLTAGVLRRAAAETGESDINRIKAFTRIGMGRCQGRLCQTAACEILASAVDKPVDAVGRLRGQAPVKPVTLGELGGQRQ